MTRRHQGDGGYSVVELSVAMAITGLLSLAVLATFTGLLRTSKSINQVVATTADARIAVDTVGRRLRAAVSPGTGVPALGAATASSLTVYVSLDPGAAGAGSTATPIPVQISYAWNGTCLNETRTAGSLISPAPGSGSPYQWTGTPVTTCVIRTTSAPVFRYFTTSLLTATALTVPGTGLTAADRLSVRSVEVSVTGSLNGTTTTVTDRSTLANLVAADQA